MNSQELVHAMKKYAVGVASALVPARERDLAIRDAATRITGVGQAQYGADDGSQRFEMLPLPELLEYAREEALDLINYGTMLAIRLTAEAPDFEGQHHIAMHITQTGVGLSAEIDRVASALATTGLGAVARRQRENEGQA